MPTSLFIKPLLMANISDEQFATLIVPILFTLLISQYSSINKKLIKYEICTVFVNADEVDNYFADCLFFFFVKDNVTSFSMPE